MVLGVIPTARARKTSSPLAVRPCLSVAGRRFSRRPDFGATEGLSMRDTKHKCMSRVDFVVDGETVEQAHPHNMTEGDVRISFDGGDTFPLEVSRWEHVVIDVETEAPE